MITFPYLEDYILWIAGVTDDSGHPVCYPSFSTFRIAPATYDVNFIQSVSEQINNTATKLTDRQFELCEKLIKKYKRQLSKLNCDIPDVFVSKNGIRTINRAREVWISDDASVICVRYPYDDKLVEAFRKAAIAAQGKIAWNKSRGTWDMAFTEYNVNWIVAFAAIQKFEVSEDVLSLFAAIVECEKTPYKIELVRENGEYKVTNAALSLLEYIEPFKTNRNMLFDHAGVLGYTISDDLLYEIVKEKGDDAIGFVDFCTKATAHVKPSETSLVKLISWAREVDRLPVVIYSATVAEDDYFAKLLTETFGNICVVTDAVSVKNELIHDADIYYTSRVIDVPPKLFISMPALVFGNKRAWLDTFEKVVFNCEQLINDQSLDRNPK